MTQGGSKAMTDREEFDKRERFEKYNDFWRDLSRAGDPARIPNKVKTGFDAGWSARGEQIATRLREAAKDFDDWNSQIGDAVRALADEIGGSKS